MKDKTKKQSMYAKNLAFRKKEIGSYNFTQTRVNGESRAKRCVYPLVMGFDI